MTTTFQMPRHSAVEIVDDSVEGSCCNAHPAKVAFSSCRRFSPVLLHHRQCSSQALSILIGVATALLGVVLSIVVGIMLMGWISSWHLLKIITTSWSGITYMVALALVILVVSGVTLTLGAVRRSRPAVLVARYTFVSSVIDVCRSE